MRTLALLLAAALPSQAGTWSRPNSTTLKFEGFIEKDEYDRFAAADDSQIKELIVDSGGGSTEPGIKIGLSLAARSIKVVVTGQCMSSCANYLFVAGHSRELRGGVVGFHGNVTSSLSKPADRKKAVAKLKKNSEMDAEDIKRAIARWDRQIADEAQFLKTMGVSQDLFDRSGTPDKGMKDGEAYGFLLPTPATFEKYGLWGIVGEQDPDLMNNADWSFVLD